jgi:hypothetical protein
MADAVSPPFLAPWAHVPVSMAKPTEGSFFIQIYFTAFATSSIVVFFLAYCLFDAVFLLVVG